MFGRNRATGRRAEMRRGYQGVLSAKLKENELMFWRHLISPDENENGKGIITLNINKSALVATSEMNLNVIIGAIFPMLNGRANLLNVVDMTSHKNVTDRSGYPPG